MSFEGDLRTLLAPLVAGRVYPDVSPDVPTYPLIIYQQVGGSAGWYVEKALPDQENSRVQVYVWDKTRGNAALIARQVEAAICASQFPAQPYGAFVALYEEDLKLYGTRQDFGIWHPR
ncbi:DUF3168 domain-containing protein [Bordetella bronchialis]|uniref:DUF3168 domain-containing protein n=1 Tax=Bordetella bronchialis TaxID=463025 RepID=A0A193FUW2_9BORD|nr:DUF3168 domain-containing protein [Bordetella bronchialis]ANN71547.1 hypothetical protein BAU08_09535 [Bordetella bronchialis]